MNLITEGAGKEPMFGLRLIKGQTWLKQTPGLPYETIFVTKILDAKNKDKVIKKFSDKIAVCRVYPRPELTAGYQPERIKNNEADFAVTGTNFSPRDTRLVFDPSLNLGEDYEMSINDEGTKITLSLPRGARWRTTSGPLNVVAILGGAGRIDLKEPVTVAVVTVPENAEAPETDFETLAPPEELVSIYRTYGGTSEITLKGTGFSTERPPVISFKTPGSAVQNVDFDVDVVSSSEINLKLRKSSNGWLPKSGVLTVSELNGEPLPIPLELAIVYDTPNVERDRKQLVYESQTVTIVIDGEGFIDGETAVGLNPELNSGEDYYVNVRDSTTLELELVPGKKWPRGALNVVWIQIGECHKIYMNKDQMDKGVRIAFIEPDFDGVIKIEASSQRIYQSETPQFSVEVLVLPPKFDLKEGEATKVQAEFASADQAKAISESQVSATLSLSESHAATLTLRLLDPAKASWLDSDGRLLLTSLVLPMGADGKPQTFSLGSASAQDTTKRGVQVARVLQDVRVTQVINPPPIVYATHTSSIVIRGTGFSFSMGNALGDGESDEIADAGQPKLPQPVILDPPLVQDEDFMVIFDGANEISLELLNNKRWRKYPGTLTLVSVDAGAGPVKMNVPIAKVAEDDPLMICTNDCPYEHPYDGVCGDTKPDPETGELTCWGRDCADCGPRKIADKPESPAKKNALCSDTCGETYVKDGICEDGRPGVWSAQCPLCSDCSDCGPCREGGYSNLPFCTNGVEGSPDELVPGIPCVFPFTYKGVYYDGSSCVKDNRVSGGWGWCPTTENYERDGKWGSCQYCVDVLDDPTLMDETVDYYDEDADANQDYIERSATKRAQRKQKSKGFDFIRWLVNTLFFLVVFSAIAALVFLIWRRRAGHQYHLVSNKAA